MTSRALRSTLLIVFVGLVAGAAYVVWQEESQLAAARAAERTFETRAIALSRTLLDIKGAQPGYVAAGQGEDFWIPRVEGLVDAAREAWPAVRASAQTPQALGEVATASGAFDRFIQFDRRAREYVRNGQRLLASDLIFAEGIEQLDTAVGALERARQFDGAAHDGMVRQRRRTELAALGGAAGLCLLIVFVLAPLPRVARDEPLPAAVAPEPSSTLSLRPAITGAPESGAEPVAAAPVREAAPLPAPAIAPAPPPAEPVAPAVDLPGIAALCTELSRVIDTRALAPALERAASLLDASGIVIWIADPDGRELAPVMAHGYPHHLVARLGTIVRDAENVTAAAFRTGLIQTMKGDAISQGAIAAPLLTPAGPVGVMAAELSHDGERRDATRAVAAIVAAQLATLMGPPSTRAGKGEAARA